MRNLWTELPSNAPYIHPQDDDLLYRTFNRLDPPKRPRTELIPAPFVGIPGNASVILLTKFPLFVPGSAEYYKEVPGFLEASRKNLTFENTEYPFYLIDPAFAETPGYQWWRPKLDKLIEDCGIDVVGRKVAAVAYFPYYMSVFNSPKDLLPTQKYAFELVRSARDAGKKIVTVTFAAEWNKQIARLDALRLKGQNLVISPSSIADGRYQELVDAIKGHKAGEEPVEEEAPEAEVAEAVA